MDFLTGQFLNFLSAIGIGLVIGLLFDIYRGLWKKCAPPAVMMPLWDVFWWIGITLLVFFILLHLTWGELRLYLFLGQIIGFVFYLKKISRHFLPRFIHCLSWVEKVIKRIIKILRIFFRIIKRIVVWPFALVGLCLYKIITFFRKGFWLISLLFRVIPRKCKKAVKKFLSPKSRNKK